MKFSTQLIAWCLFSFAVTTLLMTTADLLVIRLGYATGNITLHESVVDLVYSMVSIAFTGLSLCLWYKLK